MQVKSKLKAKEKNQSKQWKLTYQTKQYTIPSKFTICMTCFIRPPPQKKKKWLPFKPVGL